MAHTGATLPGFHLVKPPQGFLARLAFGATLPGLRLIEPPHWLSSVAHTSSKHGGAAYVSQPSGSAILRSLSVRASCSCVSSSERFNLLNCKAIASRRC
eukprot:scaffold2293_cov17-Tisochrysis_lutea.AAC.1